MIPLVCNLVTGRSKKDRERKDYLNPGLALTEPRLAHKCLAQTIGTRVILVNPNQTSETFPVLSLYISKRCVNWITLLLCFIYFQLQSARLSNS